MAEEVLTNARLFFDGYDLSGDMNALQLDYGAEMVDITTFPDTSRKRLAGLKTVAFNHAGLWQGGTGLVDDVLFAKVGVADKAMTIVPQGPTEGNRAFSFQAMTGGYGPGAARD